MKVLIVHNEYGAYSGEEAAVDALRSVLTERGHEAFLYTRGSREIESMRLGKTRAFLCGIYNPVSRRAMRGAIAEHRPDVIHIHNLFPFISPSILPECRKAGVPVVMTVHNYRLICPSGLHLRNGEACTECRGGREYRCVFRNCESDFFKSLGYALRGLAARLLGLYRRNVSVYVALTNFQKDRLTREGYPSDRIMVIPNIHRPAGEGAQEMEQGPGMCVGYVGRVSREKGVHVLLKAAGALPDIPFMVAGRRGRMPELVRSAPANVEFLGHLDRDALRAFYRKIRILAAPSICWEAFPLSLPEAMHQGVPVVCSRIGGLPEIVSDGRTGLLFEPGDSDELARKIDFLWGRPDLCKKMGAAGREKALREYAPQAYYEKLKSVYKVAMERPIWIK